MFEDLETWIEDEWKSQAKLASALGVAKNTVSQWVNGKSRIKRKVEKKLRELGYDGPLPDVGQEVTKRDLEKLAGEIHAGFQTLGAGQAVILASLEELRKNQKA